MLDCWEVVFVWGGGEELAGGQGFATAGNFRRKAMGCECINQLLFRLVPSRPGLLVQAPFPLLVVLDPWQELSGPINLAFWGFVLRILKDKKASWTADDCRPEQKRRRDLSWVLVTGGRHSLRVSGGF